MDFRRNPIGNSSMNKFDLNDLEQEALSYLQNTGALQDTPIERLHYMNPAAVEIYKENGIDLYTDPLEIALCAQHNNGGFAVDKWWQSNIPHTFIVGEMAGTHGVKRPGGSALNAGQVGSIRAAEYIVNVHSTDTPDYQTSSRKNEIDKVLEQCIGKLDNLNRSDSSTTPDQALMWIQERMTTSAGHIRQIDDARQALLNAKKLLEQIKKNGFTLENNSDLIKAVRAEHIALASIGYLKAVVELLEQGSGSRGSHLVLADDGNEIHPDVLDKSTGRPLKYKPENPALRETILRLQYDPEAEDMFACETVPVRPMPRDHRAFEPAWRDYREGKIFT